MVFIPPVNKFSNPDGNFHNDPTRDPYTFIRAEDFYNDQVDRATLGDFNTPVTVGLEEGPSPGHEIYGTGAMFRFDPTLDNVKPKYLLIQFVRPKMWRLRFDPKAESPSDYSNVNSHTIIHDTLPQLIEVLDGLEKVYWDVVLDYVAAKVRPLDLPIEDAPTEVEFTHYRLTSYVYKNKEDIGTPTKGRPEVTLLIEKDEFRITAIRNVAASELANPLIRQLSEPSIRWLPKESETVHITGTGVPVDHSKEPRVVWETKARPLSWKRLADTYATVLSVKKPGSAKYMGFGEQGGQSLLKTSTFMNYFDYDNFKYTGVYGVGPLDEREPLYHSEPFWVEFNALQHSRSKVGTFIDNLSQVCLDFAQTNDGRIRSATRFGIFDYYVMAGDDVPEVIKLYTSIIGRSHLKPRYVLGYHQACYGGKMDYQDGVIKEAQEYRNFGYPLDTLQIDVDLQDGYKTFTVDPRAFPNPKQMFDTLRDQYGVKCGTNITPVINLQDPNYRVYREGVDRGYFIKDYRKIEKYINADGSDMPDNFHVNYDGIKNLAYENGFNQRNDPFQTEAPIFDDKTFDFPNQFNKGGDYHGGVQYGPAPIGTPGHYPNLFKKEVRRWWGEQYQDLFDMGLEFVWQDMTSPAIAKKYGDMKSFPFRLLIEGDNTTREKTAIELWHLYSYQLHKATFNGLNKLYGTKDRQPGRDGKRNFIIGRGSYAGMHRYAGLWTGDNASTWDFLRISVSQVLAAGFSGVAITGVDCGGFEPEKDGQLWADPELIMRFYGAFFMLPWFRNHYNGKRIDRPEVKFLKKDFQEPYIFKFKFIDPKYAPFLQGQGWIYNSVEPVTKYLVRLRYTLMQLLYDAMFENVLNGLPISRALVITDTNDESLFSDNVSYLNNQYCVRQDLLIAPILEQQTTFQGDNKPIERFYGRREVYLPQPDSWYPFNLVVFFDRKNGYYGEPLNPPATGGTVIDWDGAIDYRTTDENNERLRYVTPMYVREGGIIPQLDLHYYVPGKDVAPGEENHITIHVYPGKGNEYRMYLDDGVSRNSAPVSALANASMLYHDVNGTRDRRERIDSPDQQAADMYLEVIISQTWENITKKSPTGRKSKGSRTVTISKGKGVYPWDEVIKRYGDTYDLVLWHAPDVDMRTPENGGKMKVEVTIGGVKVADPKIRYDRTRAKNTVIEVPVTVDKGKEVVVTCDWTYI